jgi:hypothetical protein
VIYELFPAAGLPEPIRDSRKIMLFTTTATAIAATVAATIITS